MTTSRTALRVLWLEGEGAREPTAASAQDLLAGSTDGLIAQPGLLMQVQGLTAYAHPAAGTEAVLLSLSPAEVASLPTWPALPTACAESAVVVFAADAGADTLLRLLGAGVQDVVLHRDAASLSQRLSLAVERKRIENDLLKAHATDLKTGLPNRQQLIEHMSQLLALREREHRPVSVLVLRIDGLAGVEAGHGLEAANVVRRKVAVRLRAGVRASDVVASLGANVFAVLLPAMESPADTQHVIDKLVRAVREPFNVAGSSVGLSASAGAAHFPQDGQQPEALLRHASGVALLGAYGPQDAANE